MTKQAGIKGWGASGDSTTIDEIKVVSDSDDKSSFYFKYIRMQGHDQTSSYQQFNGVFFQPCL